MASNYSASIRGPVQFTKTHHKSAFRGAPSLLVPLRRSLQRLSPPQATAGGQTASQALIDLLDANTASDNQLAAAVEQFIAADSCTTPAEDSLYQQGTWEVFYAPHIQRLSSLFGAKFSISYTLSSSLDRPTEPPIVSNVKYEHPVFGAGWLNASGVIRKKDNKTLELGFDTFWVDFGANNLRKHLYYTDSGTAADAVLSAIGRLFFISSFALFPVLALDSKQGLSVFRFPPLASNIAVRRV